MKHKIQMTIKKYIQEILVKDDYVNISNEAEENSVLQFEF